MTQSVHDAERAVLAAMLLDPAHSVPIATAELTEHHFHEDAHGLVFGATVAVHRRGDDVSVVTVHAELEARGHLQAAGGAAGLAAIMELATSTSGLASHVAIVRRYHAKTTARRAALKLVESFERPDGSWLEQSRAFHEVRVKAEQEMAPKGQFAHLMEQVRLARDLVESDEPMPASLFGDRLFCAGTLAAVVGPPKLGKTSLVLQLLRSAALGIPWLGFNWDGPEVGARVGMLQYEMTRGEMKARLKELGDPYSQLGIMLEVLCTPEPRPNLKDKSGLDLLEGWITESRLAVCGIDSHTMAFQLPDKAGRDEVTQALQGLAGVARRTGCLIVLIHHTKKRTGDTGAAKAHEDDDQDVGESASGSGAFPANTDTFVRIKPAVRDQVKLQFLCRHTAKPSAVHLDRTDGGWLERGTAPEEERDGRQKAVEKMLLDHPEGLPIGKILVNLEGYGHNVTDRTLRRYLKNIGAESYGHREKAIWVHSSYKQRGQQETEW